MNTHEIATAIAKALSDKKAFDVVIIDIAEKASFADYFVIATASNDRLLASLAELAEDKAYELGLESKGIEGRGGSTWMLIDLGDIVVNIFNPTSRDRYALDKIWGDCDIETIEE